jgi:hypothetical protein
MLRYHFLRALGHTSTIRYVIDWADHVWVEILMSTNTKTTTRTTSVITNHISNDATKNKTNSTTVVLIQSIKQYNIDGYF